MYVDVCLIYALCHVQYTHCVENDYNIIIFYPESLHADFRVGTRKLFSLETRRRHRNEMKWEERHRKRLFTGIWVRIYWVVYCRSWNSPIRFGGNGRPRVLIEIRWKFNNLRFLKHTHTHTHVRVVYTAATTARLPPPETVPSKRAPEVFQIRFSLESSAAHYSLEYHGGHSLFALVYDTVIAVCEGDPRQRHGRGGFAGGSEGVTKRP